MNTLKSTELIENQPIKKHGGARPNAGAKRKHPKYKCISVTLSVREDLVGMVKEKVKEWNREV
jgi:hypothetical protein